MVKFVSVDCLNFVRLYILREAPAGTGIVALAWSAVGKSADLSRLFSKQAIVLRKLSSAFYTFRLDCLCFVAHEIHLWPGSHASQAYRLQVGHVTNSNRHEELIVMEVLLWSSFLALCTQRFLLSLVQTVSLLQQVHFLHEVHFLALKLVYLPSHLFYHLGLVLLIICWRVVILQLTNSMLLLTLTGLLLGRPILISHLLIFKFINQINI